MYHVFYCKEFNEHDLGGNESPLRKKFSELIEDLKENKCTSLGDIKLIRGKGDIKYFRAKLSGSDRLLFTSIEHNGKNAFIILEVILNHKYDNSKFLTKKEKIKNIEIVDKNNEEVSDNADKTKIGNAPQVRWLGKLITFSTTQEEIVENASNLPLIVSGSPGSGKTSIALEKLRKIEEEFKEGKILYITKSENLIKKSKELYEYAYYDKVAKEEKTGVPKQIEFLSVHEFLKKAIKEDKKIKKCVERKKPISRSAFFSWFNKKCEKGKFKQYKKDGDKMFEEFTAVIAGKGLKRTQYDSQELGVNQAIFPKEERGNIYSLFEEYRKFIEGSSEYCDTSLIAHECVEKVQANYDAVVVDEVQDLTESTLSLILKGLKDESKGNFLLCGDVNQVIHPSFFSLSKLKSFLCQNKYDKELKVCVLEKNYRNSKQVIEFANRILHLKNYCFASEDQMTEDEEKAFFMKSDTENPGNVGFIGKDKEQEIAGKISESTNWAVLVLDDKSKEDAYKLFNPSFVFNIHEAKGLEFENVILYKFTFHEAYNKIWNVACPGKGKKEIEDTIKKIRYSCDRKDVNTSRPKDKEDKSFEEHKFYIHALHVAVTRAVSNVYITEGEKQCNLLKVVAPGKGVNKVDTEDIKKEKFNPKEWRDMALTLIYNGNMEQAKGKVIKLLEKGEQKYVKEIIDVLEAEGYSRKAQEISNEIQFSLDKDKSEQAIAVKKESGQNPIPQKSSMGESRTSTETGKHNGKKHKAQVNANKEGSFASCVTKQGDCMDVTKSLLSMEANVSTKSGKGYTPLHVAVESGKFAKIRRLLNKGANVNAKSDKGYTSLHMVAQHGHYADCDKIVKYLLNAGANVDAKSDEGYTPLHIAAQQNTHGVFKLLLKHRAKVDAEIKGGYTPLHLAAQNGHKGVVQLLLDKEASVDARDERAITTLHLAAQNGHEGVVQLLLKKGASVNAKIEENDTPLHFAAGYGHTRIVVSLLSHGADVNAKNNGDITPLHWAVQEGHDDLVQLLLSRKADVDAKCHKGTTPLRRAAQNGHKDIVELLLNKEADVNGKDNKGTTPLYWAAEKGHKDIVQLLLDHKADVNGKNNRDTTPLHWAAEKGNKDIVQLLLDHKADVNAKCHKCATPLHLAAQNGHKGVVQLLLDKEASVDARDERAITPLHLAALQGHKDVVELLLEHGVNVKSDNGNTPLALALKYDHSEIVNLLLDDPNINVSYNEIGSISYKNKKDKEKFLQKLDQDNKLFKNVEKAAKERDEGKLDKLLKEIEELLKSDGFKPGLNYSPDGEDENTTIEIAIEAGGKILQLLYGYAKKHIDKNTKVFKQLKHAKEHEKTQPKSDASNVSVSCPFDSSSRFLI